MARQKFRLADSGGADMTPDELLAKHSIKLASTAPGRYYTTCPQCSPTRSSAEHRAAKVLGVTVDGKGVCWGCTHCDWRGPEKGTGASSGRGDEQFAAIYNYLDESSTLLFQVCRSPTRHFHSASLMAKADGFTRPRTFARCSIACPS
jgi:hypothetical protein